MSSSISFNFKGVVSDIKRIWTENERHFHALNLLFVLPLLLPFFIYRALHPTSVADLIEALRSNTNTNGIYTYQNLIKTLSLHLIYTLFSQCAVGTITYSSYHGFYGRPVKFVSAVKSLLHTFIPLAATAAVSQIIMVPIGIASGILAALAIGGFGLVELRITDSTFYFNGLYTAVVISVEVVVVVMVYMQVNWSVASVVVVVESKWGFEALRRSWHLVEGMRGVALRVMLIYWLLSGFYFKMGVGAPGDLGWGSWWMVVSVVCSLSMLFMAAFLIVHYLVGMSVLYVQCKAKHGELALEVAQHLVTVPLIHDNDNGKVHPNI